MNNNNVPGRMQPKGRAGCWFHSILNGFLLSWRARELIKERLELYKRTNLANFMRGVGASGNACPARGRLNSGVFWAYLDERLRTRARNFNTTVNHNVLISNLGLRLSTNGKNRYNSGNPADLNIFIMNLWPAFATPESPILSLTYKPLFGQGVPALLRLSNGNPEFNSTLKNQGRGLYRVSHAYISTSWPGQKPGEKLGHAICGYVTRTGKQMIYDSNDDKSFQCNWRTNWRCVREHIFRRYMKGNGNVSSIKGDYQVVFIRSSGSNTVNINNVVPSWPPNSMFNIEPSELKTFKMYMKTSEEAVRKGIPAFMGRRLVNNNKKRKRNQTN